VGQGPDIGAVEVAPVPAVTVEKDGANIVLEIVSASDRPVAIEGSDDLAHWTPVFTVPSGQASYRWPVELDSPFRFYRLVE
jgi:hypothetical protein